ncbi:uncharacterized protein LOC135347242 isoform X2 [Halichondria panicea]|uniref:uncharacterized protein LOC135347242 isoform X2 n=1 Tax=Halichondria panicea TaxID=6063 RepID=UPI00312B730A
MKMTSRRHARYLSNDLDDDVTLVFRKPSWQLRASLASVLITPVLYQLYLIMVTIRYILFLQTFSSPPRPACPVVDLSWTGVFPCELGWRGSALVVLILSAVFITCYSLITACLVRWNPRKQWNSTTSGNIYCHNNYKRHSYFLVFDTQEKPIKFQVRAQSSNRPPTLSLYILLLIFRLLLQSGDVEANPGPTFSSILTLDDLNSVYKNLIKAVGNWFNLGLDLGLGFDTLNNISDKHRDNQIRLCEVLAARLKTGPLTYSEICQSLRAPTVERNDVAEAIEEACTVDDTSPGPSKTNTSTMNPEPTSGAGLTETLEASMLDTVIKDGDLIHLATYFDSATLLAAALSLDPHEDGDVKRAENTRVAVHLCLKCWKRRKPKEATFQALLTIVRRLGKEDTATSIEEYSKREPINDDTSPGRQKLSTTTPGPTKSKSDNRSTIQPDEAIGIYRSYLTSIYDTRSLPADDKYPLQCVKDFVNLECADVSKHLSREEIEESWSKIVQGKLDRFPRERITMDQIASKVKGKFSKLVVIKGAPGGGKTTLSWELCRRWANDEVWTDYSLVVLLRLRDENIQEAVELVDLFQCEDTDDSKNIYTIIRKNHGQGILFILEGLDELPPSLREKDSIFMKLITGRLLPASTVLVTTRPWAVCDLPVTCSSRVDQFIEILGFSGEQIKEYIDLMIKNREAPPELREYINSNPHISSAMYNPLHARIVVDVYKKNYHKKSSVFPTTTTELYTAYCQVLIERYLHDKPESDWSDELSELPWSLQVHFDKLCQFAYIGITKEKQQLVFFKEDVVDTNTLGFMNSVHPLHNKSNSSPSYNFLHLTLQEFLAAFYVWKNKTPHEQLILFETNANDGSYKMILLFLAGLTKLNDPWTQCVLPTPYVKGSSKAERMCRFSSDQILWIYESQNVQAMKDLYCNVLYELPLDDWRIDQFALGYVVASAHFKVTLMDMFKFNISYVDRSMMLAGINKVLPSFTLSVRHLKMSTTFKIPSAWHSLTDRILPELESVTISNQRSGYIDDKFVGPEVPCTLKIFDTIELSPNLSVVELDFGISRDTVIRILDILKPKHCLKVLKCARVSPADEELLSDFIAHSSIEMLVIHLVQEPSIINSPIIINTDNGCISIGLNVTELKRNNTKILPHLLSEISFTNNKAKRTFLKTVFSESTTKNLISILSHWKLSLQYLRCSSKFHLTPAQSEQLFSTLLNCPILKELDIQSEIKGQFEYFCTPQHLQSLTLLCPDNVCELLRYLKDNRLHSIKSLKLTCHLDCDFDEAIGEYLQTDTSLEELTLHHVYLKSSLSHLMQGLQVNTSLTKLNISPYINYNEPLDFLYTYSRHSDYDYDFGTFQLNTTLQFIELMFCIQLPGDLLPALEALRENNTVKHLTLCLYVPPISKFKPYTVTTEEAEAVGNVLAKNKTLEVFHLNAEITDYSPIVRGLLENKTLKEFGTSENTKKNIVTCPEYVDVRRRIVFMKKDPFNN